MDLRLEILRFSSQRLRFKCDPAGQVVHTRLPVTKKYHSVPASVGRGWGGVNRHIRHIGLVSMVLHVVSAGVWLDSDSSWTLPFCHGIYQNSDAAHIIICKHLRESAYSTVSWSTKFIRRVQFRAIAAATAYVIFFCHLVASSTVLRVPRNSSAACRRLLTVAAGNVSFMKR